MSAQPAQKSRRDDRNATSAGVVPAQSSVIPAGLRPAMPPSPSDESPGYFLSPSRLPEKGIPSTTARNQQNFQERESASIPQEETRSARACPVRPLRLLCFAQTEDRRRTARRKGDREQVAMNDGRADGLPRCCRQTGGVLQQETGFGCRPGEGQLAIDLGHSQSGRGEFVGTDVEVRALAAGIVVKVAETMLWHHSEGVPKSSMPAELKASTLFTCVPTPSR